MDTEKLEEAEIADVTILQRERERERIKEPNWSRSRLSIDPTRL